MSHADEVITDVTRRRVHARAGEGCFTIAWDYPGRTLLEVRILRSETGPAATADEGPSRDQQIVYDDVTGSFKDTGLGAGRSYHYTVFARHPGGEWVRWGEYEAPGRRESAVRRVLRRLTGRGRVSPAVLAVVCLVAVLAAPAALAGASGSDDQSSSEDGGQRESGADAAIACARADASVAAVLAGKNATAEATPWRNGGDAGGYSCVFRWPATQATSVSDEWPLLRTGDATPKAPYEAVLYRLRAGDLSALRVDVLGDGSKVIQILPLDSETTFSLYEQTWPPMSWLPWFTQRPWVLAPVFIAVAVLLMVRAWRRSRAWNRRMPSMTRHDRQFIARVVVLLFLLAGFGWQIYQAWYAATGPSANGLPAGDLTALPAILIPPALFVAGLVLELSPAPHRGSWALLAVLSGAASVYYLATALTGTTTNLNLDYYILLGILALISVPRAFSAGKMGWSRSHSSRFG